MNSEILVSAQQLRKSLTEEKCLAVDCRYTFGGRNKGRADWLSAHIPSARYAHLDDDLAAPVRQDSGRHPLPQAAAFSDFLASIGWSPGQLIVAYDDGSNAISVRLWWLMRYFGHAAAVLDGGLKAWVTAGFPLESGAVPVVPAAVTPLTADDGMVVSGLQVLAGIESGQPTVLDARAAERFAGQLEPLDSKAGHIPGALNRPFQLNLSATGCFKKPDVLRSEFTRLLGDLEPTHIAHSCGSGVTACHNIFAMELAGISPSRLYAGSWSEWIRDPDRPISTGS